MIYKDGGRTIEFNMDMFKCIEARYPKAYTAIFKLLPKRSKKGEQILDFLHFEQDDDHPYISTAYTVTSFGDSGSPIWTKSYVNKEYRQTLVAVQSSSRGVDIIEPATKHCRGLATKLTNEVITWIKEKGNI